MPAFRSRATTQPDPPKDNALDKGDAPKRARSSLAGFMQKRRSRTVQPSVKAQPARRTTLQGPVTPPPNKEVPPLPAVAESPAGAAAPVEATIDGRLRHMEQCIERLTAACEGLAETPESVKRVAPPAATRMHRTASVVTLTRHELRTMIVLAVLYSLIVPATFHVSGRPGLAGMFSGAVFGTSEPPPPVPGYFVDVDEDGVNDADDFCIGTGDNVGSWRSGSVTDRDGDGCMDGSAQDRDRDNDGIDDQHDACPDGEVGVRSNRNTDFDGDGCMDATEDPDGDGDGVPSAEDDCPRTPLGSTVDARGCSAEQAEQHAADRQASTRATWVKGVFLETLCSILIAWLLTKAHNALLAPAVDSILRKPVAGDGKQGQGGPGAPAPLPLSTGVSTGKLQPSGNGSSVQKSTAPSSPPPPPPSPSTPPSPSAIQLQPIPRWEDLQAAKQANPKGKGGVLPRRPRFMKRASSMSSVRANNAANAEEA